MCLSLSLSLLDCMSSLQEVEVYVKSTQTDMVSIETQRNDDEDEDEAMVPVVSSAQSTAAPSELDQVGICLLMSL